VTSLPAQVYDCPVPFALLEVAHSQPGKFVATKSAGEQQGKQCSITFALDLLAVRRLPECLPLFRGQPVAKPYAQFLYALDPPYARRQISAEESAVCRLVRKTAHCAEAEVDRGWSEIAGLQMYFGAGRPQFC
jgi:hypothetical protein